jgi:hypothetical protein
MAGTSPAMTLEAWFNMTGTCSRKGAFKVNVLA